MPKTTNLGLNLTTDDSTDFYEWQKSIDGEGQGDEASPLSNMQIIDNAIGDIASVLDIVNGEVL